MNNAAVYDAIGTFYGERQKCWSTAKYEADKYSSSRNDPMAPILEFVEKVKIGIRKNEFAYGTDEDGSHRLCLPLTSTTIEDSQYNILFMFRFSSAKKRYLRIASGGMKKGIPCLSREEADAELNSLVAYIRRTEVDDIEHEGKGRGRSRGMQHGIMEDHPFLWNKSDIHCHRECHMDVSLFRSAGMNALQRYLEKRDRVGKVARMRLDRNSSISIDLVSAPFDYRSYWAKLERDIRGYYGILSPINFCQAIHFLYSALEYGRNEIFYAERISQNGDAIARAAMNAGGENEWSAKTKGMRELVSGMKPRDIIINVNRALIRPLSGQDILIILRYKDKIQEADRSILAFAIDAFIKNYANGGEL